MPQKAGRMPTFFYSTAACYCSRAAASPGNRSPEFAFPPMRAEGDEKKPKKVAWHIV